MNILIQCGDHYENQLRIKSLALLLKNNGYNPIILVYNSEYGGMFVELGIEIVYLKNYTNNISNLRKNVKPDSWLDINIKYNDILSVEAARQPKIMWPGQIKKTCNNIYKTYHALIDIILKFQPKNIVIWNGQTGIVANCLRVITDNVYKVPVFFLERGLIKNSLFIDECGVNGASSLSIKEMNLDNYEISSDDIDNVFKYFPINRNLLNTDIVLDIKRIKTVFFPLQVQRDTNILFYSDYTSMREVFLNFINYFHSNINIVIRPHPEEDMNESINIPQSSQVSVRMDGELASWIQDSDLILTINSTVGLEALIQGKPVITFGKSIYSDCGITFSLSDLISEKLHKIKYINVIKYLVFLLKNNIVFEGSPYNCVVINNKMNLENVKKDTYQRKVKIKAKNIKIFPLLTPKDKLNLTYKKNKVDIDLDWIINIINDRFDYESFEYLSELNENKDISSDDLVVMIVGGLNYKQPVNPICNYVLDIYGNILKELK